MIENPFQSPQTVELSPTDRVYEPPLPGGWRPGLPLTVLLLGSLALLAIAFLLT
ncbi:MAG: hypothetical protein WD875_03930 [Pirellulales bacterium]